MRTRGLRGLTALTLIGLAILIGLGVWQLNRLEWKQGVIAKIEERSSGAPITLDEALALAHKGEDPDYYRVSVEGRFDNAHERHLYAISDGKPGWHVITPLRTQDELVFVDRGFVPDSLKEPASRLPGQIKGTVTVTGLVRKPEGPGPFTPDNEPEANRWFWPDLYSMLETIYPTATIEPPPFFLEAEKSEVPGGWPEGGQTRLDIPNNHLQYALTWFALAACLAVIYAVYVWSAYRKDE